MLVLDIIVSGFAAWGVGTVSGSCGFSACAEGVMQSTLKSRMKQRKREVIFFIWCSFFKNLYRKYTIDQGLKQ